MRIEHLDLAEWGRSLPETEFEVFHTPEALAVLRQHAPGELILLGAFKGDRPVGLFPATVRERAFGRVILSPPPGMGIPRMGPLVMPASPKQRKREGVYQDVTEATADELGVDEPRTLSRVLCPTGFEDPRPFTWDGMDVQSAFTYTIETADRTLDDLESSFSKSLRRDVRDGRESAVAVSVEGRNAARRIHQTTAERYREQDREYTLDWPYVRDLTGALRDVERCRSYVARAPDGEFLSGITALYSNDAAYFWQGGTRASYDGVSVNSLLHWRILADLVENPPRESVTRYDLMGANTERLCSYKGKFGGDLTPYYVVESGGPYMGLAKRTYRAIRSLA